MSTEDRPHCLNFKIKMLSCIAERIVPGYELRNFECPSCDNTSKLVGVRSQRKTLNQNTS